MVTRKAFPHQFHVAIERPLEVSSVVRIPGDDASDLQGIDEWTRIRERVVGCA